MDLEAQKKLQEYSKLYFSDSEEKKEKKEEFHTQLTPEEAEAAPAHIYTPAKKQEDERDAKKEMNQTISNPMVQHSPSSIMKKMGIDTGTAIVPNTPKPDFGVFGKRVEKAMNTVDSGSHHIQEKKDDDTPATVIPTATKMLKNEELNAQWLKKIADCVNNNTPRKEVSFGGEILFYNIEKIFVIKKTNLYHLLAKDAKNGKIKRYTDGKRYRMSYIYNIRDIIEFGQRNHLKTRAIIEDTPEAKEEKPKAKPVIANKQTKGLNHEYMDKNKSDYEALKFSHKDIEEVNKKKDKDKEPEIQITNLSEGISSSNDSDSKRSFNPNNAIPKEIKEAHQQKAVKIEGFVQEIPVEVPISIELFGNTVNITIKTVVKVKIG